MSHRHYRNAAGFFTTALTVCTLLSASAAHAQTAIATYLFNNSLNAQESGDPALSLLNPVVGSTTGFQTMNVTYNGVSNGTKTVLHLDGNPASGQNAGLQLNVSSLLTDKTSYSFETVFEFTDTSKIGAWRKILDVSNRSSDTGFYVDTSNHLDAFNSGGSGPTTFNTNTFYHVVLTQSGGTTIGYLNGVQEFSVSSTLMNVDSNNLMSFFLDDNATGNGEYSDSDVAMIRLYNGALSSSDVAKLSGSTLPSGVSAAAPEPGSLALLALAAIPSAMALRRRLRRTA